MRKSVVISIHLFFTFISLNMHDSLMPGIQNIWEDKNQKAADRN